MKYPKPFFDYNDHQMFRSIGYGLLSFLKITGSIALAYGYLVIFFCL